MKYLYIFAASIIIINLIAYTVTVEHYDYTKEIGRGFFVATIVSLLYYAESRLQKES